VTKKLLVLAAVVAFGAVTSAAYATGADQTARAGFIGSIKVSGAKATLKVRYRCAPAAGVHLWVSAKQTKSGVSAARLMKEGSSRASAAWWDTHRARVSCSGTWHTAAFTIDRVEKGTKGQLRPGGTAWVQFCITTGTTEANTVLLLSRSGWVHVTA
jgi:hypothetical protein